MVLVTGGAGFIGSHTCVELINAGYDVVVVDNLYNSHEEALDRVKTITGKRPLFYNIDVCDKQALDKVFSECDIDEVIHFAGLKAVGESVRKPLEYFRNNLDATMTLMEVMNKHDVKRLVFSSSATVYSGDNEMPLVESSRTGDCTNPYGWTKYMSEQMFKAFCVADSELSIVLLRYFNPVGAHESGLLGEDPQGIPNNLMPYVTQVAIGKRDHLTVFGDDYDTPDGTGIRDYIHVVDLARAHLCALVFAAKNTGCEIFNIGSGKGSSVLDIVHAFEHASGQRVPYVIGQRRAGDLATVYADPAKAKAVLGFETKYDLQRMCEDSWRWQKKNPNGFNNNNV